MGFAARLVQRAASIIPVVPVSRNAEDLLPVVRYQGMVHHGTYHTPICKLNTRVELIQPGRHSRAEQDLGRPDQPWPATIPERVKERIVGQFAIRGGKGEHLTDEGVGRGPDITERRIRSKRKPRIQVILPVTGGAPLWSVRLSGHGSSEDRREHRDRHEQSERFSEA